MRHQNWFHVKSGSLEGLKKFIISYIAISKFLSDSLSEDHEQGENTLAKRIAAQRAKDGPGSKNRKRSRSRERIHKKSAKSPERSVELVKEDATKDTTKTDYDFESRKMKVQGGKSESVQSVIADVDKLLKSSDPLPETKGSSNANDSKSELMAELDDFINS